MKIEDTSTERQQAAEDAAVGPNGHVAPDPGDGAAAVPVDDHGEPTSGFVASEPKPAAPEQATHGEPFAAVVNLSTAGTRVDPFEELSEREHGRYDARIEAVLEAQRSGEELASSRRRRRRR